MADKVVRKSVSPHRRKMSRSPLGALSREDHREPMPTDAAAKLMSQAQLEGPRAYAMCALMRYGGLRPKQVAELLVDDYDVERGHLTVRNRTGDVVRVDASSFAHALVPWLAVRHADKSPEFIGLSRDYIRHLVAKLGKDAGVQAHADGLRFSRRPPGTYLSAEAASEILRIAADTRNGTRDAAMVAATYWLRLQVRHITSLRKDDYDRATGILMVSHSGRNFWIPAGEARASLDAWWDACPDDRLFGLSDGRIRSIFRTIGTRFGEERLRALGFDRLHSEALRDAWHPDEESALELALVHETQPSLPRRRSVGAARLSAFRPELEDAYMALIASTIQQRQRLHGPLVNAFAKWLSVQGVALHQNRALDMVGMADPPVIVEAEVIRRGDWARAVREAVGQLYEYRHFQLSDPAAALVFLASEKIPWRWARYLREVGIEPVWQSGANFKMTRRAAVAFGIATPRMPPRSTGQLAVAPQRSERRLVGLLSLDATDEEADAFVEVLNDGMPEADERRA